MTKLGQYLVGIPKEMHKQATQRAVEEKVSFSCKFEISQTLFLDNLILSLYRSCYTREQIPSKLQLGYPGYCPP